DLSGVIEKLELLKLSMRSFNSSSSTISFTVEPKGIPFLGRRLSAAPTLMRSVNRRSYSKANFPPKRGRTLNLTMFWPSVEGRVWATASIGGSANATRMAINNCLVIIYGYFILFVQRLYPNYVRHKHLLDETWFLACSLSKNTYIPYSSISVYFHWSNRYPLNGLHLHR